MPLSRRIFILQSSRLGFIDKEKDKESGDHNFGVRQYSPSDGGRFLSIDKYWEKYRNLSPYQYAGNNPLICYDSDGKEVIQVFDENATAKEKWEDRNEHRKAIEYLKAKGIYGAYKALDDKNEVEVIS